MKWSKILFKCKRDSRITQKIDFFQNFQMTSKMSLDIVGVITTSKLSIFKSSQGWAPGVPSMPNRVNLHAFWYLWLKHSKILLIGFAILQHWTIWKILNYNLKKTWNYTSISLFRFIQQWIMVWNGYNGNIYITSAKRLPLFQPPKILIKKENDDQKNWYPTLMSKELGMILI